MKLKHAAIIATTLVVLAGFAMISPLYLRTGKTEAQERVMLAFSVSENGDALEWCRELSSLLDDHNVRATIFLDGIFADKHPEIVAGFGDNVDIGSQTYNHVDLTAISDYSAKLQEVKDGKAAVDAAGDIDSRVFRAPFNATDQDIYSLLSRSGILADFSYSNQYNLYQNEQFVKYDVAVYEGRDYSADFFATLTYTSQPLIIFFDNTFPISNIESYISTLEKTDLKFTNASELAGFTLTDRR